jgi:hypothetical protein
MRRAAEERRRLSPWLEVVAGQSVVAEVELGRSKLMKREHDVPTLVPTQITLHPQRAGEVIEACLPVLALTMQQT